MTATRAHSRLGGSVVYRFKACPGSVAAAAGMPNRASEYAAAGTVAHYVGECDLSGEHEPGKRCVEDYLGERYTVDEHVIQVDQEMVDGVRVYVGYIREILAEHPDAQLWVEVKVDLRSIHPEMFGTSDAVIYIPSKKLLIVLDFKYGYKYVDAEKNDQLLFYALGVLLNLRVAAETVRIGIVQPRRGAPIRTWDLPTVDIFDYAAELRAAGKATEDPNAPRVPGLHCDYCPAAAVCPELRAFVMERVKRRFAPENGMALPFDPAELAQTMREMSIVKNWIKRTEQFAFELALKNNLPTFKLVDKRPQRAWRDEETAELLLPGLGIDRNAIFDVPKLRSPAQIEKLVPKTRREEFNRLVIKQSSGLTLAPVEDEAPAVKRDAASEFRSVEPVASKAAIFD
jgi:hypothetical protein